VHRVLEPLDHPLEVGEAYFNVLQTLRLLLVVQARFGTSFEPDSNIPCPANYS
jgi:hypothetical protein